MSAWARVAAARVAAAVVGGPTVLADGTEVTA